MIVMRDKYQSMYHYTSIYTFVMYVVLPAVRSQPPATFGRLAGSWWFQPI